jgi:hypothetical protein
LRPLNGSMRRAETRKKRPACATAAEPRYKARELAAAISKCDQLKTRKKRLACVALAHRRHWVGGRRASLQQQT